MGFNLKNKTFSILLGVSLISTLGYAQVDSQRKSIAIGSKTTNELPKDLKVSPEISSGTVNSGTLSFKTPVKLNDPEKASKKREVYFGQGEKFAKKDYSALEDKLNNKFAKKDADIKPEYLKNQNLGEFKSGSKFVKFVYRDHQFVDGDRVRVYINDHVVHPNIVLTGEFQGFYIDLEKGFNKIDIQALNQGTSGPNTAQFIMYDDNKQVISSNIWNLATGVKASVVIVKDE